MVKIWRGIMPTTNVNRLVELEEEEITGVNGVRTVQMCHTVGHAASAVSTIEGGEEGEVTRSRDTNQREGGQCKWMVVETTLMTTKITTTIGERSGCRWRKGRGDAGDRQVEHQPRGYPRPRRGYPWRDFLGQSSPDGATHSNGTTKNL